MSGIPGIYGQLSPEAAAAYSRWIEAVLARAEHLHDCGACARPWRPCGSGAALYEAEIGRHQEWRDIRHQEAQP